MTDEPQKPKLEITGPWLVFPRFRVSKFCKVVFTRVRQMAFSWRGEIVDEVNRYKKLSRPPWPIASMLIVAAVLLSFAAVSFVRGLLWSMSCVRATATIVDYVPSGHHDYARFQFTVDGETYKVISGVSSTRRHGGTEVGREVAIEYPPAHPELARRTDFLSRFFNALGLGFVGIWFGLFGSQLWLRLGESRTTSGVTD